MYKQVLIESDWNLKEETKETYWKQQACINRIRLEFKAPYRQL